MVIDHMPNSNVSKSPLEVAAGAVEPHVTDAFKLLSDEIRLAILLALWEVYDPHAENNAVSFSQLFDRVGVRDSGNFSYHLNKLIGHYVEETDDGYRLRNSGLKIVRAVIAGSGLEKRRLPPTEIPRSCYHCGAPVELSYEDERLYQICTECEGNLGPESTEKTPTGTLVVYDDFNPAGLAHRTPEEVFVAGTIEYSQGVKLLIRGACPECSGPIQESLEICDSHDAPAGELCPNCGTSMRGGSNEARVSYVCSVCKHSASYPAWVAIYDHPAVVAFYHEHGCDMTYGLDDPEVCGRLFDRLKKEQTVVSKDPVRIRVTVTCDGAELYLTLDGDLTVVEMARDDHDTDRDSVEDASRRIASDASRDVSSTGKQESDETVSLPDTEACLQTLRRARWPDGIQCLNCSSMDTIKKGTTNKGAQRYKCHTCDRKFNDLSGTLFAGHRLSLPEMFHIVREMNGMETAQIARQLDRSYKTVLEFTHKARDISNASSESTVVAAVTPSNST
jgi:transposase-like protein/DNA-binding transcriptional ArsR family regulator